MTNDLNDLPGRDAAGDAPRPVPGEAALAGRLVCMGPDGVVMIDGQPIGKVGGEGVGQGPGASEPRPIGASEILAKEAPAHGHGEEAQPVPRAAFKWRQAQICSLLNISREELRERRKKFLEIGRDEMLDGQTVLITDAGLAKIRASLHLPVVCRDAHMAPGDEPQKKAAGLPTPETAAPAGSQVKESTAKNTGVSPAKAGTPNPALPPVRRGLLLGRRMEDVTELLVFRLVANARIVEAHAQGTDPHNVLNIQRVSVRNSQNFTKGMRLPVRWVANGLFEFTGRLPRWKGKY